MVSEMANSPSGVVTMDLGGNADTLSLHLNSLDHLGLKADSRPRASSVPLAPPTYSVGYVYDAAMMSHSPDEGDDHPEQPQRIVAVHNMLLKHGCLSAMKRIPFRRVQREAVLLVHTEQHWRMVLALKCKRCAWSSPILTQFHIRSINAARNNRLKGILRARFALRQSADYGVCSSELWRRHRSLSCRCSW
jgi:hypothetical protein